jgi:hypothetical protein
MNLHREWPPSARKKLNTTLRKTKTKSVLLFTSGGSAQPFCANTATSTSSRAITKILTSAEDLIQNKFSKEIYSNIIEFREL